MMYDKFDAICYQNKKSKIYNVDYFSKLKSEKFDN